MLRTSNVYAEVYKADPSQYLKKNRLFLVLIVMFFIGMVYGAIVIRNGSQNLIGTLSFMTDGFVSKRSGQTLLSTLVGSFSSNFIFIFILFLMGFSAISQPFIFFSPCFYGLGVGLSMGYMYTYYGLKGVGFCGVMILPHACISALAIVLASKESIRLSNLFLSSVIKKIEGEISLKSIKLYCAKYLVILVFIIASAIIDSSFSFLFARFFVL
ncbi:MAG: hypothetical protein K0R90_1152 [Oscillospiraceae bacterium]|jgi:stage II sporulation protein M|nr:hypothetical protein [Oscillospiraceae bacterium]